MGFYRVMFEDQQYMSLDLYRALTKTTAFEEYHRAKTILGAVMYGPMTKEEISASAKLRVEYQDFDETLETFEKVVPPLKQGSIIAYDFADEEVFKYKNRLYVAFKSLRDSQKYRFQKRLPIVKIGGRGMYVCLNVQKKGVEFPLILMRRDDSQSKTASQTPKTSRQAHGSAIRQAHDSPTKGPTKIVQPELIEAPVENTETKPIEANT